MNGNIMQFMNSFLGNKYASISITLTRDTLDKQDYITVKYEEEGWNYNGGVAVSHLETKSFKGKAVGILTRNAVYALDKLLKAWQEETEQ